MKTVAKFEIEYLQYLNEHSEIVQKLPAFADDLEHLKDLYRRMQRTRLLDAKAIVLQRTGKMGTYPSSLGQEAISTGLGDAMRKEDVFCPYYRDQGALLERGVTQAEILSYWGGDERGADYQHAREDFPLCVPIATQCLHACGVAFAFKYRKQPRVVVTAIGDGGTSEGDFYEALNLAGAWQLPVVFVINNNQWAISVPRGIQTNAATLAQKGIAAGIPSLQVDGNDVIAVRDAVATAVENARTGGGPTLIEAISYRLCDHTTADDARRYWDEPTVTTARAKEPLIRLRAYLTAQNAWSDAEEEKMLNMLSEELDAAVKEYINKPAQPPESIMDFLYEELPEAMLDQRESVGVHHA
ncbi:MAG: pyruvate dehydrogenase (acetyl-transferring) E1 component subunit alpha [Pseudomonadota bacterium]|nr:pyruvate dehydrogenase (acetyl-transferring) E1 component subunit alpha [Pseudomonadota bacterium]